MENNTQKNRQGIILLILLLLSLGFNIYQWTDHDSTMVTYDNRIDSMIMVRTEIEKELTLTTVELEKYRGISTKLDSMLNEANNEIALKEKSIRDAISREKNSSALNKELKKQLAELQKMKEEYLERIDVLIQENDALKRQNEQMTGEIQTLNTEKSDLQQKVKVASELKVEYVKVTPYKKQAIGGKIVETSIASRTFKIDVCFSVLDNKITDKGEKTVHLRILAPNGQPLAGISNSMFTKFNSEDEIAATATQKIDFTGEKQDICLAYEGDKKELKSGDYPVEIYIEGQLAYTGTLTLR